MARKISKELQDTVKANPHIQDVHFTAKGEHFFDFHELKEKGSGKVVGKYARLGLEAVHVRNEGDRKIYKNQNVPLEDYKIVETLSREEILKAKPELSKEEASLQSENEKLKAQLEQLAADKAKAEEEAKDAKAKAEQAEKAKAEAEAKAAKK
jgi:membrane protein involved in colicin uptake